MDEIKVENNINVVCHGCLSRDRSTTALGVLSDMFLSIVGSQKEAMIDGVEDIKLCWECTAMLKKFKSFQNQLKKAQNVLMQMLYDLDYNPTTLSKLTTSRKDHYDYNYTYTNHIKKKKHKQTNQNSFIDIEVEIKESDEPLQIDNLESIKEESYNEYDSVIDYSDHKDDLSNPKSEVNDNELTDLANYEELTNLISNTYSNLTETLPEANVNSTKRAKRRKLIKSRDNSVSYYKQFTSIIQREKIDWGNVQGYFTMTTFSEEEMEEHFLSKERKFSECTRFKFKCVPCERGYLKEFDLQRHNDLNHNKTTNFECSECKEPQTSLNALATHWREHTPIARCNLCGDVCRPRGMRNHLNYSHTNKYACTFCNMQFGTMLHFSVHYKSMHQYYICDYCNATCKSKTLIQKHIRSFHTKFECKECDRQYPNYRRYKRHLNEMHPTRYMDRPELAYCVECDKQYASVSKYRKHLTISPKHIEPKRILLPCPDCGKMFRRKNYLNNHYNLYHAKKSKHYCELCDKYFANGYGLKNHKTHVHMKVSRVKDKMCDLCGRGFATNRILINHRRTHTGERPYQCPFCSAAFTQKQAMQSHCRTQHKDIK